MEAGTFRQNRPRGLRRFLGTRRGAFTVAAVAAALSAIALVAYLNRYKDDVQGGTLPTQVLVADRLIPKGSSGDAVASGRLFRPTTIATDDVKAGALSDAAALSGKVATRDIYPGQQIAVSDFSAGGDRVRGRLTGFQRGVAVPVDEAHGLNGNLRTGDTVDVLGYFGNSTGAVGATLVTIAQDVLVLKAPPGKESASQGSASGPNHDESVVLRLNDVQSARVAYAADNGKVWLALRPPTGDRQHRPALVTGGAAGVLSDFAPSVSHAASAAAKARLKQVSGQLGNTP